MTDLSGAVEKRCAYAYSDDVTLRVAARLEHLTKPRKGPMIPSVRELEKGAGVLLIRPARFVDSRGYVKETWSKSAFSAIGLEASFVQDNESFSSSRGTLRGLHYQRAPFAQAKLVRVLRGAIFDVVVDVRPDSSNRGRWYQVSMTAEDDEQLFIPRGFAHGFVTLSDNTVVAYKVDSPYAPSSEAGIRWNDTELDIRWPVAESELIVSPKDGSLPSFRDALAICPAVN